MRWHDERINHEVATLHPDLVHDVVLIDLLRRIRDDYERALLNQRAETIALAQRVAQLEEELQNIRDEVKNPRLKPMGL